MARPPRIEVAGGLAHVTARTIRRFPLFIDQGDALALLSLLDHITRDLVDWRVLAYCLMPNHFHLVLDAEVEQLSLGMQHLNGKYAQRFNRVHGFRGHLFQGRFHSEPIRTEAHLPTSVRYVVLNPVRAGLCDDPEQWRWSSYGASIGLAPVPPFISLSRLLACFDRNPSRARHLLRAFVEAALAAPADPGSDPGSDPDGSRRAAA